METNGVGPLHFTEIYQTVSMIDENGKMVEGVELHVFFNRATVIVDNLRERFKQTWQACDKWKGKLQYFEIEKHKVYAEALFKQYDTFVGLVKKVEGVVKTFKEKLPYYDEQKDRDVTQSAAIMCRKDIMRIIEDYTQFGSKTKEKYFSNGVTFGVQTSTKLQDRYEWLKKAYDKQCGKVVDNRPKTFSKSEIRSEKVGQFESIKKWLRGFVTCL